MVFKIKISGITSKDEARIISSLGADAIGLLVGNEMKAEKNIITTERAKEILSVLSSSTLPVVKTVSRDVNTTYRICNNINPKAVQIIPDVKIKQLDKFRESFKDIKIIKVIPVVNSHSVKLATKFEKHVDAILLDTKGERRIGGTGKTHNWDISAEITRQCSKPVILAGGLNSENIEEAIKKVRPYGVDAETCFEKSPGIKDFQEIHKFIATAMVNLDHNRINPGSSQRNPWS